MGNFMKKMKSAAEQAKVKDHPLFTREYRKEIRNAYFSGAAASLCFLDDELDAAEQHALTLLGQSLHLSADEISEGMKTVQDVGEDDKMEFLQEVFALMDSDYLKYALLTDIHTLCLKKGQLTEDEKDFINASAEILFGEEKNVFELLEKGLTLENAEKFSVKDGDKSNTPAVERDPFFVKLEERNKPLWTNLIDELKKDPELCKGLGDGFAETIHVDHETLLAGYDAFRNAYFNAFVIGESDLTLDMPFNPVDNIEGLKGLVCDGLSLEDLMKMKTYLDFGEAGFYFIAKQLTDDLSEQKRDKAASQSAPDKASEIRREKILQIIAKQLGCSVESLTDDANFIEDLGADSLDQVELVMAMEEEFKVAIPDEDAVKMQTVGDAIRYAEERLNKQ